VAEQRRRTLGRIQIGIGLFSWTIAIAAIGVSIAAAVAVATESLLPRILVLVVTGVGLLALWLAAIRNERVEKEVRERLKSEHPGSLVERVRIWALPHGRLEPGTPDHFLIADTREISFETVDQVVLLRIPVPELGFADLVTAQGDRAREKAMTLIYGEFQDTVQFFTITFLGTAKLRDRVRRAIGWPEEGTP
jgi:hypothetical protein